jgi:hypothetical protein
MKKFIIGLAAIITLISATAFAGEKEKLNPALATFQKEFKEASDVKWLEGKDVIKAAFNLNNFRVEAYFSNTGELLGTARSVLFNQLPLTVIREINNRYGSASVYEITEYNANGDTFYCMTVELSNKKLLVKATSSGELSVESKIKK